MTRLAVAASVGAGVLEALSDGFEGRVESVFPSGFYVRGSSSDVFAVLGAGCWAGPLHLLVPDLVSAGLPVPHDRVSYSDGILRAGCCAVRVCPRRVWSPCLPMRLNSAVNDWRNIIGDVGGDRRGVSGDGRSVIGDVNGDWRGVSGDRSITGDIDPELATVWPAVTVGMRHGDLVAVSRLLAGLGTGLTPSGDDVLAGILLVCAIDRSRRPGLSALASSLPTTQLSSSYLRWAALGQSIQPAHALLDAAAKNDPEQMGHSARLLAGVGATSGRALLAGMVLAATDGVFYNDLTACCRMKPVSESSLKSH